MKDAGSGTDAHFRPQGGGGKGLGLILIRLVLSIVTLMLLVVWAIARFSENPGTIMTSPKRTAYINNLPSFFIEVSLQLTMMNISELHYV
jgi:hypothetical protein